MPTPTMPPLWNLPYQRNPYFTGREEVLNQLHRTLHAEHAVALSQPQGITGLGGIGKTQTVLEYAYRYGSEYDAVLWVRADSNTSLISSMIELARILELPERNEQDQEIIVQAVLRWFRTHTDWLLIYDNLDDFSLAERFLPKAGAGHLLFTTRAHALGGLAERLEIQQMEPDIGALLLLRRASLLALQATVQMAKPDEHRLAQTISQELDGLPLALDQAGAYIKETPSTLPAYLTLYQTRRGDLLRARGRFDQDYPASVATTWSLSFERISQVNPAAPELLYFFAFLAPDAIPEELLTAGATHLGEVLAPVVTNPLSFDQVCKEVLRFSLLQRGADEHTLSVHRLVQTVLRDSLPVEVQQQWMQRTVPVINAALPKVEFANWPIYERLVAHALVCATWIERVPLTTSEASRLLNQTGRYLVDRARYPEAEPLFLQAVTIQRQQPGSTHPDTAQTMSNLGSLYIEQGRFKEAEPLFLQAVTIQRRQLGSTHLDTAQSLHYLGWLYSEQGRHKEAEPLFQMALETRQHLLGPDHPDTLADSMGLGWIYVKQGRFKEAEPLFQNALEIRKQKLGLTHPTTAQSCDSLGYLYWRQCKYKEAELLYKQALEARKEVLGSSHPATAQNLLFLALAYRDQGQYVEAYPLCEQAITIYKQGGGLGTLDLGKAYGVYALVLFKSGKRMKAACISIQALRTLGLKVTLRYFFETLRAYTYRIV